MEYTKQIWQDGVTPLDAQHMNYMEEGIAAANQRTLAIHADQHSWNDTLTWDGDTTGRFVYDSYNDGTWLFYHISDVVPTKSDFVNGYAVTYLDNVKGEEVSYYVSPNEDEEPWGNPDGAMFDVHIAISPADNYVYDEELTFPKKGIYFMRNTFNGADSIVLSLTIPGYVFESGSDPITPEMISAAPKYHASESGEYGMGTAEKYGHLKVADVGEVFNRGEETLLDVAIELPNDDPMIDLKPYALGAYTGYACLNYLATYVKDHDVLITEHNKSIRNLQQQTLKQDDRQSIITDALAALAGADPSNASAAAIQNLNSRTSVLETNVKNHAEDIETLMTEMNDLTLWIIEFSLKIVMRLVQLERNAGLQPPVSDDLDTNTELDGSYDDIFGQA